MGFTRTSTLSEGIELASWKNAKEKDTFLCFSWYLSPFLGSDPACWSFSNMYQSACVHNRIELP